MELNQRLVDRLVNSIDSMGPDDVNWNQFVHDHKSWLKQRCQLTAFDPAKLVQYRYRPEEFYAAHDGIVNLAWIWLLINDIYDPAGFNESRTEYYMIDQSALKSLYEVYRSSAHASS